MTFKVRVVTCLQNEPKHGRDPSHKTTIITRINVTDSKAVLRYASWVCVPCIPNESRAESDRFLAFYATQDQVIQVKISASLRVKNCMNDTRKGSYLCVYHAAFVRESLDGLHWPFFIRSPFYSGHNSPHKVHPLAPEKGSHAYLRRCELRPPCKLDRSAHNS